MSFENKDSSAHNISDIKFLNYNVCGLKSKLSDKSFLEFVCDHDFITFTETFIYDDIDETIFKDHQCFVSKAIEISKYGRLSGGVVVLVKKHLVLSKLVSHVKTDNDHNIVVLKLSKDLVGSKVDVMYISAYIQPYDSVFWKNTIDGYGLEVIEECIVSLYDKHDDFLILLSGDFNARTASRNYEVSVSDDDFEQSSCNIFFDNCILERKSDDKETNIFGEQLIELCKITDCFIINGVTSWKCDSGYTYIARNGSSVIDCFLMSCNLSTAFFDVKLKIIERVESDHLPVQMTLYTQSKDSDTKRSDCNDQHKSHDKILWDNDKEYIYKDKLVDEEGLTLLKEATEYIDENVDTSISLFNQYLLRASECMKKKIVVCKSFPKSEWFDEECKNAKKECRTLLRELKRYNKHGCSVCYVTKQTSVRNGSISHLKCFCHEKRYSFVECRKSYRKLLKQKKQQFRQQTAENLTKNAKNSKLFWNDLKKLGLRKDSRQSEIITLQEWFQHFQTLFSVNENCKENTSNPQSNVNESMSHVLNQKITREEVEEAVRKIKGGKASGTDGVIGQMLKAGGQILINFFTILFNEIFDSGIYPSEWSKAIVVPIFKKGNIDDPDNYRGISLINTTCKCFTSILNKRLYLWLEDNKGIVENQAGFRRDYSTIDQIFNLYSIVQKSFSCSGRKLYVAFVDFKKAFDSVQHNKLLEILQDIGIKGKFFCTLKSMYDSLVSCVRSNGEYSDFFECPVGVRQGCGLSPTLFSLFINQLANHINSTGVHGVQLLPTFLEIFILLFADDIALISSSPGGLQVQLNNLSISCDNLGLKVNREKTKIMVFRKGGFLGEREKWYYDGERLEVVNSYCYLGFTFTTMLSGNIGTNHLVTKAKKALYLLCRAFQNCKEMSKEVFFKIFDSKIQSILLYSSEIWGLQRLDKVEKVHVLACKRYLGVPLKTPNKLVYSEIGRYPLYINTYMKAVKYWFRLLELDENRLPKQAYLMLVKLDEKGKKCWATGIRDILSKTGFLEVWLNQGVNNVNLFLLEFKQRLVDIYLQEWTASVRDSERYALYRSIQCGFGNSEHLKSVNIFCLRVALTQIRLGVLPLKNNTERFCERPDARFCIFCKNVNEDEFHFLYMCPVYTDLRKKFLGAFSNVCINTLLSGMFQEMSRAVAKYIFHSIKLRQKLQKG